MFLHWRLLKQWSLVLAEFGLVQIGVQFLGALASILIIRSMSKSEYALFAITNSMQTTCNLIADMGIGIGVRSIGGKVWSDSYRFGQLINTALGLRRQFAVISFGVCLPITGWMLWENGASFSYALCICIVLGVVVIPLLSSSVFGVSAGLNGEFRRIQKLDLSNAFLRLVLIAGLALSRMNAILVVLIGGVTNWIQSLKLRRWAQSKADLSSPPHDDDKKELLYLSVKMMPNTLFFCFQGQITLLILTFLGSPAKIADITAIGRVSALLTVFSVSFANVIEPRFARCQDSTKLPGLYILIIFGSLAILSPILAFAWFAPEPFIWLIGSKYAGLERECGLMVMAGCITQFVGVIWNLNISKGWIRTQPFGQICSILLVQIITALMLDLHQFRNVLIFNIITAAAPLPLYLLDSLLGLKVISRTLNPLSN